MKHVALGIGLLCVVVMCGCGGSGSAVKPPGEVGTLSGKLVGVSNPESYGIVIDGKALEAAPAADGSFRVPNLPAGRHSVALVGSGGMMGAYVDCNVVAGRTVSVGNVTPGLGGQIVGLVMKLDANGGLSPLEGVEVLADSEEPVYITPDDDSDGTTPPERDGNALQFKAITDENGSYVIPAVPEGSYIVTVNVPGLTQGVQWVWVSPGTTAAADFQLEEAIDEGVGTVAGVILGADSSGGTAPLEGAMVTIYTEEQWVTPYRDQPVSLPPGAASKLMSTLQAATGYMVPPYWFNSFSTLTNAEGEYTLNVPSGYININVWIEGYEGVYERFGLQPRTTVTKNFTLQPWEELEPRPEPVE